jgi:hypothetical protein
VLKVSFEIFVASYVFALAWGIFKKNDIELLPSLSWLFLMVLPFWAQFDTFPDTSRLVQAFGVVFIGTCLLIGDSVVLRLASNQRVGMHPSANRWVSDFRVYALLLILIAVYHLSLLDYIPLVEKYLHRVGDARELSLMREQTSKLLPVHSLTKYIFTWAVNIVAPLAIVLAWSKGRYLLAAALLGFALMYAAMSLAKVPLFLLGIILLVVFLQRVPFSKRLGAYVAGLLLLVPVVWDAYSFFVHSASSVLNYKATPEIIAGLNLSNSDPRAQLTIGDHSRLRPVELDTALGTRERLYNYYAYRLFLGPADVSSRWYQYFPAVSGQYIGLQGLTPADRERSAETHPARRVGAWAYGARFPDKYLDTAQAYASVDADAYARFGSIGILGAGLFVLALRLLLKRLRGTCVLEQTLYAVGLVLFALLWPLASLQAVLLSNGLAVVIGLMLLANWLARRRRVVAEEPWRRFRSP